MNKEQLIQKGYDEWYGEPTHQMNDGTWVPKRMINTDGTINQGTTLDEIHSFLTRMSQKGDVVKEWAEIMIARQDPKRIYVIHRKILHYTGCPKEPEWTPSEVWMSWHCDGWTRWPMTAEEVEKLGYPFDRKCRSCKAII